MASELSGMRDFPEINLSNYDVEDVSKLQQWGFDALDHIAELELRLSSRTEVPGFVEIAASNVGSHVAVESDSGRNLVIPFRRWQDAKVLACWILSLSPATPEVK